MITIFLLSIHSSCFLNMSPGVMSQGLGGVSIMIDEGLSAFHNPAAHQSTKVTFTIARWLYATHHVSVGAGFRNTVIGISYLNYGSIQGYNEYGSETHEFNPFDICFVIGRKLGPIGIAVKAFEEKIDTQTLYGICGGISSYVQLGTMSFGAKLDNIGKEFGQQTAIPLTTLCGVKLTLPLHIDLIVELRYPDFEIHSGFMYTYEHAKLLFGARYMYPHNLIDDAKLNTSLTDMSLTSGLIVQIKKYEIGYSFVYTEFSNAHQLSVTLNP